MNSNFNLNKPLIFGFIWFISFIIICIMLFLLFPGAFHYFGFYYVFPITWTLTFLSATYMNLKYRSIVKKMSHVTICKNALSFIAIFSLVTHIIWFLNKPLTDSFIQPGLLLHLILVFPIAYISLYIGNRLYFMIKK